MKKVLLPSLLITIPILLVSITGCQTNQFEDYQVNMEDFEKIVSMEDVQYLQFSQNVVQDEVNTTSMIYELSPTVYHMDMTSTFFEMNVESYVYIQNDRYWRTNREHDTTTWSQPEEVDASQFSTPQKIAETIKWHYKEAVASGTAITFDKEDLAYKVSYVTTGTSMQCFVDAIWNFYQNKMTDFAYSSITKDLSGSVIIATEVNQFIDFKYEQYTPPLPI